MARPPSSQASQLRRGGGKEGAAETNLVGSITVEMRKRCKADSPLAEFRSREEGEEGEERGLRARLDDWAAGLLGGWADRGWVGMGWAGLSDYVVIRLLSNHLARARNTWRSLPWFAMAWIHRLLHILKHRFSKSGIVKQGIR